MFCAFYRSHSFKSFFCRFFWCFHRYFHSCFSLIIPAVVVSLQSSIKLPSFYCARVLLWLGNLWLDPSLWEMLGSFLQPGSALVDRFCCRAGSSAIHHSLARPRALRLWFTVETCHWGRSQGCFCCSLWSSRVVSKGWHCLSKYWKLKKIQNKDPRACYQMV